MNDPVFSDKAKGNWNVYDETWSDTISDEGYATEEAARKAFADYCAYLNQPNVQ